MNAQEVIKNAVYGKKIIYLGEEENRSIYKVTFFYCEPDGTEEVYICSNENNLEMVIDEFCKECKSLFAVAYKKIGEEF